MKETQKVIQIKGEDYLLNLIPGSKGLRLLNKIRSIALPALAELEKDADADTRIGGFVNKIMDGLDKIDIEVLAKELITSASKQNMVINFDNEFAGEYDKLFLLLKEIIMFNFGSVFTFVGFNEE